MRIRLPEHNIIGIDPGPKESAVVTLLNDGTVNRPRMVDNWELGRDLSNLFSGGDNDPVVVVETLAPMGHALGQESLDTHGWAWVFWEAYKGRAYRLSRRKVLAALGARNDASVHAACLDLLGLANDKEAKGTGAKPGPLYGIKKHIWQALGVALAWVVLNDVERRGHY